MAFADFRGLCREAVIAADVSGIPVTLKDLKAEACARGLSDGIIMQILEEEERSISSHFQRGDSSASGGIQANSRGIVGNQSSEFGQDELGGETPIRPFGGSSQSGDATPLMPAAWRHAPSPERSPPRERERELRSDKQCWHGQKEV
ncbi:unnamed protein product [Polarella glacialis]|uniref:Uncharacterized protein n=1 Tax=Polarella glacialis TaxID=89957 RepID=A0A813KN74_POLGL|nr:unnamed protein product [Polarella glacialis]